MKKKFNLVGNTFTHLTNGNKGYSVHGKESKYIEWVTEGADDTFYIDNTINDGIGDGREGKKYLWLLESKFIKQGLVESIIENREVVEDTYEIIFTHHYNDLSNDHKIAYEASITAARPFEYTKVNAIFSFEVPSASEWRKPYSFNPNFIVDISKEIKDKLKAISMYKHELRKFPHPRSKEVIDATATRWGGLYGYSRAEAFEIVSSRATDLSKLSLFTKT